MSLSIYDPNKPYWSTLPSSSVLGGKHRAESASRDIQGRFLPKDEFSLSMWELDERHGRAGGLKRAATAKRFKGKFA